MEPAERSTTEVLTEQQQFQIVFETLAKVDHLPQAGYVEPQRQHLSR